MSTRSAIIRKTEAGTYEGVYCHSDGYPEGPHGVGWILNEHYQDSEKVKALIALGDLSYLQKNPAPGPKYNHKFDQRYGADREYRIDPAAAMAYHRDRGEPWKDVKTTTGKTLKACAAKIGHDGYVYVFADGDWTCNGEPLAKVVKAVTVAVVEGGAIDFVNQEQQP